MEIKGFFVDAICVLLLKAFTKFLLNIPSLIALVTVEKSWLLSLKVIELSGILKPFVIESSSTDDRGLRLDN